MAHAYSDPQTFAGIILGTGTNAAYVEKMENIAKWKGSPVPSGEMVINTEVDSLVFNAILLIISGAPSTKSRLYFQCLSMIANSIKTRIIHANKSLKR